MAVINCDPFYYIDNSKPTHTEALELASIIMGDARRTGEWIRIGYVNAFIVDGLNTYDVIDYITRTQLKDKLIGLLLCGNIIRIEDKEYRL